MHIIRNRLLPPPPFLAINIFGLIFVRRHINPSITLLHHERIHTAQMRELLFLGFYLIYLLEFLLRLLQHRHLRRAYRHISFEQEAYRHQSHRSYLSHRCSFAQWRSAD